MDMQIRKVQDEKEVVNLINFMNSQPQYYPEHSHWLNGKCRERILQERYLPIFALNNKEIVGSVVYDILDVENVEIKHFRIDKNFRNRNLGQFLMKQVEVESKTKTLNLDTTVQNFVAVEFFIRNGFDIIGMYELYVKGQFEYLMRKNLNY